MTTGTKQVINNSAAYKYICSNENEKWLKLFSLRMDIIPGMENKTRTITPGSSEVVWDHTQNINANIEEFLNRF